MQSDKETAAQPKPLETCAVLARGIPKTDVTYLRQFAERAGHKSTEKDASAAATVRWAVITLAEYLRGDRKLPEQA